MKQSVEIIGKVKKELVDNCDARHKIIVGGRGKGASWSIARILLMDGMLQPLFIVCVREVQKSIEYSVKKLLTDTIAYYHWEWFYTSTKTEIRGTNGTKFIFNGLREHNADSIKSLEGAQRCWVAEAQSISRLSIDILRPTIRDDNAVFWWDYNRRYSSDPIYVDYEMNKDPNAKVLFLNWRDNPWFPKSLTQEKDADYRRDEVRARHIWEGELADANELFACPQALVFKAQKNIIHKVPPAIPVIGADIAHQGGDEIVFYKRIGNKTTDQFIGKKMKAPETLASLKVFAGKNCYINIDNGHLGCAVADLLEEDGYTVNRISFGGTPKNTKHYEDVATEMFFELKEKLEYIQMPIDEELAIQLYTRKYKYINGKRGYEVMKVESTEDWAEHTHALHKSPDRSSAMALCFYEPSGSVDLSSLAGALSAYGN